MKKAPINDGENERQEALNSFNILDTPPDLNLDEITNIAAYVCDVPISLVSLIDMNRQWFKSKVGLDATETPRDVSFCGHAIYQDEVFIIENSLEDERFKDNPLVTNDPHVIFYAGAPLKTKAGYKIGTLCVIDNKPRKLNDKQIQILKSLSHQVINYFELKNHTENVNYYLKRYYAIVENMAEGVVLQDKTSKIIDFNPAALKILCLTEDELLGKTSLDPSWKTIKEDESDFPGHEHPAVVCLSTGKLQKDVLMGVNTKNVKTQWINITAVPIFDGYSTTLPSHTVCTFTDITSRKIAEQQLLYSSKMTSLGEMAGGIAHEINSPLSIISGRAEQLIRRIEKETISNKDDFKNKLLEITSTSKRIIKIIKGLRQFSRNSENDPLEIVNLSKIIENTISLCQERFKNHFIEIKISGYNEVNINCRTTEISQVLLNLLNNSFDALENLEQKWVEINTKINPDNNILKLSVIDSGNGISDEILDKIMQPFFTTKEVGKGTGLGLSISKGLIEQHNGKLYYDKSALNTTFVIELPFN